MLRPSSLHTSLFALLLCAGCGSSDTTAVLPIDASADVSVDGEVGDALPDNRDGTTATDGIVGDVRAETDASTSSDGADGAEVAQDGSGDAQAEAGGPAPCDPAQEPTGVGALFVSPKAVVGGNGSRERPFGTVGAALAAIDPAAETSSVQHIYLDTGIYAESIAISGFSRPVVLEGGYHSTGEGWKHICAQDPSLHAIIASPTNVGVRITGGDVTLQDVTISTADGKTLPSGDGESTYGVWASGKDTILQLVRTVVVAGKAGNAAEASGIIAAPAHTCSGLAPDCADAAAGAAGAAGDNGKLGTFTAEGYQPVAAKPGAFGAPGHNGAPGAAGLSDVSCVSSCTYDAVGCDCVKGPLVTKAGGTGTCGCGGVGGNAGREGHSGGASLAVFVGTGAMLALQESRLTSGDGGKGTHGALGTDGLAGSLGAVGAATADCFSSCAPVGTDLTCTGIKSCAPSIQKPLLTGGAAGTAGGKGGKGGGGGAGSGGPSYALVTQANVVVAGLVSSTLQAGTGGAGGVAELNGEAAPQRIVE